MDWSWTGELHHRHGATPEWCRATEASVEWESIQSYTFIWSYAKTYIGHFTDTCIRKDRLHSIGWKSNFFSIFLFRNSRAQSYHNPAVRRNARKSYIYTYNRQHSHRSAFSQGAYLVHLSFTYSQSKTLWSLHPSRHLAGKKRSQETTEMWSQGQVFSGNCGGWGRWGTLDCWMEGTS